MGCQGRCWRHGRQAGAPVSLGDVTIGTAAFAATNLDDVLLLAAFFAQPGRRVPAIVAGQFIGIGALVAASIAAALAALAIPPEWIALIGVAPVALGVMQLLGDDNDAAAASQRGVGMWAVAIVTIANGGDNLGVYIPLFASRPGAMPVYVGVFAALTAVWCAIGYLAVSHPSVASRLQRYGHRLLPWVLIGIGVHVLAGAIPLVM